MKNRTSGAVMRVDSPIGDNGESQPRHMSSELSASLEPPPRASVSEAHDHSGEFGFLLRAPSSPR